METFETSKKRIAELENELTKCKETLKKEKQTAKKHEKDNTCIFRIKNNTQFNYYDKSPVNQRRCRKQIRNILKNIDTHIHGIGDLKLNLFFI